MQISTFKDDLIGLKDFSDKLKIFIDVEHDFVSESLVISLNAGFGAGKSTFLKMWTDSLKKSNEESLLLVNINAWDDDYCDAPLLSIVSGLIESLEKEKGYSEKVEELREKAKYVAWFCTELGNQLLSKFTGVDLEKAVKFAGNQKAERTENCELPNDLFDVFMKKKEALNLLKSSIQEIVKGDKPKLLILVDELDRCRPDYAISYLETIKHIFDIHGIVFILAVDRKQLECSAKASFGNDLDFAEYYRKFVKREVALPELNEQSCKTLVEKYVKYYLERENVRYCYMKTDRYRIKNITELISLMQMTPRQIKEVFRIMGHVLSTDESNKGRLLWCWGVGAILMSALKVGNPDLYKTLGTRELSIKEASDLFRSLEPITADWWVNFLFTGNGLNMEGTGGKEVINIYQDVNKLSYSKDLKIGANIGQFYQGWGKQPASNERKFEAIYSEIEELSKWN